MKLETNLIAFILLKPSSSRVMMTTNIRKTLVICQNSISFGRIQGSNLILITTLLLLVAIEFSHCQQYASSGRTADMMGDNEELSKTTMHGTSMEDELNSNQAGPLLMDANGPTLDKRVNSLLSSNGSSSNSWSPITSSSTTSELEVIENPQLSLTDEFATQAEPSELDHQFISVVNNQSNIVFNDPANNDIFGALLLGSSNQQHEFRNNQSSTTKHRPNSDNNARTKGFNESIVTPNDSVDSQTERQQPAYQNFTQQWLKEDPLNPISYNNATLSHVIDQK